MLLREGVDGSAAVELLGKVEFWLLEPVPFEGLGMSECFLLKGEKGDVGAASVLFREVGTCVLAETVFSGDALLVCFAFLLRYLGRTLSSQYKRHCSAV